MIMQSSLFFASSSLEEGLKKACTVYWNKTAVSQGDESYTYEEFIKRVIHYKTWLNNSLSGKTVLIKTENTVDTLFLLFGAIISDCIPLFYDPVWKNSELQKATELNACSYIITNDFSRIENGKVIQEYNDFKLLKVKTGDIMNNLLPETSFCRFTSGSTGFSRCLQFTEQAFLNAGYNWVLAAQYQSNDKIYCVATLNNGLAFNTSLLAAFFSGAELILHKGPIIPSAIRKVLDKKQPTVFVGFPLVYELIVNSEKINAEQFKARLVISSAAPLTNEINKAFQRKFLVKICNYYGLAEVGPCTFNEGDLDNVGKALKNVEIKIGDNNQVLIKSGSSASDFLDVQGESLKHSFTKDGFFITKDIGEINKEGKLILKGRVGRLINIQGRKIDPVEIETLIGNLPGVKDVLVKEQDLNGLKLLTAYIESASMKKETILKFCSDNLAIYKVPQQIIIKEKFPRSSSGKISITNLEMQTV